ncbi:MauE/DoxX family redox-associated membrane protein [Streptosporangium sp. NPDC048865]|uniref:MauE/DoxX family redox-associated membrane protein n=1 Tax=Streptosporangium sp. NPDC048865 TaxID=3155766 RepID=UPI00341A6E32
MLTTIAAAQLPVVFLLLVAGTVAKIWTVVRATEPGTLSRLGPAVLVPERWRAPAMLGCAFGECFLANGLLLTGHPFFRWGIAGFFAISTYVLWELRRRRPDVGCGCFGEVSALPVGRRSLGRTMVLTAMALGLLRTPEIPGWEAIAGLTWAHAPALLAGVLVLVALSPEIEETVARLRYRAPCEQRRLDPASALGRLRSSTAWRSHEGVLSSREPVDSWRELCWRFFVYPGTSHTGDSVDVVFAVYLSGRHPAVRVAMVGSDGQPLEAGTLPESLPISAGH